MRQVYVYVGNVNVNTYQLEANCRIAVGADGHFDRKNYCIICSISNAFLTA